MPRVLPYRTQNLRERFFSRRPLCAAALAIRATAFPAAAETSNDQPGRRLARRREHRADIIGVSTSPDDADMIFPVK